MHRSTNNVYTHRQIHNQQMLYLFVGVFKLISLSPGENSNCLPWAKVDDKGREEGGLEGRKDTTNKWEKGTKWKLRRRRKFTGNLNRLKMCVLTWNLLVSETLWQVTISGEWNSVFAGFNLRLSVFVTNLTSIQTYCANAVFVGMDCNCSSYLTLAIVWVTRRVSECDFLKTCRNREGKEDKLLKTQQAFVAILNIKVPS